MDIEENFRINLYYVDEFGQRWRFHRLCKGQGYISPSDFDFENFYHAMGGIELVIKNHLIFFQSFDFHDLLGPVTFLLKSLVKMDGDTYQNFSEFHEEYGDLTVAKLTESTGDYLLLESNATQLEKLTLSYLNSNSNKSLFGKDQFYFKNIEIDKQIWVNATHEALIEYFNVLKTFSTISKEDSFSKPYLERLWFKWNSSETSI